MSQEEWKIERSLNGGSTDSTILPLLHSCRHRRQRWKKIAIWNPHRLAIFSLSKVLLQVEKQKASNRHDNAIMDVNTHFNVDFAITIGMCAQDYALQFTRIRS